jgi:antitoxin component YwqK of YwqJK toxin-antitoxin module/tetratricopeptide (TPR) repeat protein
MKNLFAALLLGLCSTAYSQKDYTYVYDSETFIKEGIHLYDDGKYPEAIKQFEKVDRNDPKFFNAQYEKAISLAAGENKDAAKAFYEEAFAKGYMAEAPEFYMAYGNFLSDQKEYDKAEKMFLEAQKLYPNSSVLLYNMALLYVRKDERQKCVDYLERAITINPNHGGSHYMLGLMALEDGRVTEGTMALLAYLTLVPNGGATETAILKLNAKFAENYLTENKLIFSRTGGDNFEEIDVILRNSLPLKSAYKVHSTFDDVIIRQVQAVAEYCVDHKGDKGFFETTYVPWLADLVKKKQFEGFSYYILIGMEEKLGKKLTSQTKKIKAFAEDYIAGGFWDVFAKRKVDLFGKEEEVVVSLQNGKPYFLGKVVNGKKEGKYKVLDTNGNMTSELNFANDELEGLQKYYDYKGKLTEEKNFSNGKVDGKRTVYYNNGTIELVENYKNDLLEGISTSYYINGGKHCEGTFSAGERDGTLICLYENGTKSTEINYAKGKLNGKSAFYDVAGNVTSEQTYVMDKRDGKSVEYYDGKVLKSEITYTNGTVSSPYKSYFPNTTLQEETSYAGNNPKTAVYNFANGKKSHEIFYDKEGYITSYDYYSSTGGEKYFQENYKQGELKTGLQFEQGKPKPTELQFSKGAFVMKNFEGSPIVKGQLEKGKKKGEWTYFFASGAMKLKENYQNDLQVGLEHSYGIDSRLSSIANYANDTLSGIYETYDSGNLQNVYHYSKGKANGPSKSFYPDGKISGESFYIDGDLYSKKYSYWQNGNIRMVTKYIDDTSVLMEIYNVEGKKESEIDYTNKSGKITTTFNNGMEIHEYDMTNGNLNGKYIVKDKKGRVTADCVYLNGMKNGRCADFGPTGALLSDVTYYAGKYHGVNKYYDMVGTHRMSDSYIFGDNTGLATRYYHNKGKFSEYNEYDGNIEGEYKYFNLKGDNVLILGYQNNKLMYYTTIGKDGKLTEKVPVNAQTAKIVSAYPNGKTALEVNIIKGSMDGKFVINSAEGKTEYESVFDMGLLTGIRTEYYANGKIYKRENFLNSNFEGLQEFFKEDGKPWLSAEYKNDQLHGLCKIYTNGTITQTQRYDSDELIEIK